MAKLTSEQLAEKKDEFGQAQVKGYEDLYNAEPVGAEPVGAEPGNAEPVGAESGSVIFDFDVKIGKEIRAAIEKAMPEHENLFRRAMEIEKKRGASQKEAFRIAFEAVYGGVLFEHGHLGGESQKALTARLGKVLKTPIEMSNDPTKNPMAGRPELQAATERLRRFQMGGGKTDELLNKAFAGVAVEGEKVAVHGFETQFGHAANRLKEVREYFEAPVQIDLVRHHYSDLDTLVTKAKADKFTALMREVGLNPTDPIKGNIKKLDARIQSKRKSVMQDPKNATTQQRDDNEKARDEQAEKIAKLDELLETLKDIFEQSKKLYEEMKALARNLEVVKQANAHRKGGKKKEPPKPEEEEKKDDDDIVDVYEFPKLFKAIDLRSSDFDPAKLVECYDVVDPFLKDDTAISGVARALAKAEKAVISSTNLTDEQAAKKIVVALVGEQFPDMSVEDRGKMATMILAEDVMRLQQSGTYEEIAREGSAEFLDTVKLAGFREKLIGFRYKLGERIEQPFKGLRPSDFNNWTNIEDLFETGRLNHKNGFFVIAALEAFEEDAHADVRSVQSLQIERKLKMLLAEKMGVKDKMSDSRVAKIVSEAFDDQMERVRPLVQAYSKHHDSESRILEEGKVQELNTKWHELIEKFKLGQMSHEIFERKRMSLLKEAREASVHEKVEFSRDSIMADWYDSPDSEWLRGLGYDIKEWGKAKSKGVASGVFKVIGAGILGTAKFTTNVGLQAALLPFRAVKYPLLLAAKPVIGLINLFRRTPWQPLPGIIASVKRDVSRMYNFTTGTVTATSNGVYNKFTGIPKDEWNKAKGVHKAYKDRTDVDLKDLQAKIQEDAKEATPTPIETSTSPFIDVKPYIAKIKELGIKAEEADIAERKPAGNKSSGHKTVEDHNDRNAGKAEADHGHGETAHGDSHHKKAA